MHCERLIEASYASALRLEIEGDMLFRNPLHIKSQLSKSTIKAAIPEKSKRPSWHLIIHHYCLRREE